MSNIRKFKVSSYLKDIIGRDLVTNEYIAIFELVKNSFDAGATKVDIEFNAYEDKITIVDDGNGMSRKDILEKWLFVAYSDKSQNSTDTYRDKIKPAGQFAGSKGIGRFSCDTLGTNLELYSIEQKEKKISKLKVDWTKFEKDSLKEFQDISVDLVDEIKFPECTYVSSPSSQGTMLVITGARHEWDESAIGKLRRDLAKLIDPFGTSPSVAVSTWMVKDKDVLIEGVDGPVGNEIADVLTEKTSRINVLINNGVIDTTLYDRGRKIYVIREPSPYSELADCKIEGDIYFLNRSAKQTFTLRMGVRSIEFGSVFLFLNKFRVFPIGEEFDDTLGLNRRKQQGQARYLGTRDILGRVDVIAKAKKFREVSSRDAGLVEDANSRELFDAIRKHMIFRLERYVVGVNWKDSFDQGKDTSEGLETDKGRERILSIIGALARSKDVDIIYYDDVIVRVPDDPDQITDDTLKSMLEVAKSQGNSDLLHQIEEARVRIDELRTAREEAREIAQQAVVERHRANARIALLEKQAAFLGSSLDVDVERVQLLMHQATIHSGHIRSALANAAYEIRNILSIANTPDSAIDNDDVEDLFASIRQSARRVSSSIAGATLSGDRLGAVLSFAPNIRVDLQTDQVTGDLLQFFKEYFEVRLQGVPGMPTAEFEKSDLKLYREFSPVDISVIIDNLIDNSKKASANKITFKTTRKNQNCVAIKVTDDGFGINERKVDPAKIFERGYSGSANGTGIGLYSVRQIIEQMGGTIALTGDGSRADFEMIFFGAVE